jgi:hypothetical protein
MEGEKLPIEWFSKSCDRMDIWSICRNQWVLPRIQKIKSFFKIADAVTGSSVSGAGSQKQIQYQMVVGR